jgi:uncharacterized cupin superfamily protein
VLCAGFPAGVANGHQLVNDGDRPARYLEISNRHAEDSAAYPDVDLVYRKTPTVGRSSRARTAARS